MLTIHAVWTAPWLHLWGESSTPLPGRKRARWHPFAAAPGVAGEPGQLELLLPTTGKAPLYSHDVAAAEPRLERWIVPTRRLPAMALYLPEELRRATSVRVFEACVAWARALIARERILPHMLHAEARWLPILDDPADLQRLTTLARALPPAARGSTGAIAAVRSFMQHAVDGLIREAHLPPPTVPGKWPAEVASWIRALFSRDARLPESRSLQRLATELERWKAPLQAAVEGGWRTCFRLEPPIVGDKQPTDWRLGILA
jgi:hypothetical protein